jgi:Tol biopolymer transport system component
MQSKDANQRINYATIQLPDYMTTRPSLLLLIIIFLSACASAPIAPTQPIATSGAPDLRPPVSGGPINPPTLAPIATLAPTTIPTPEIRQLTSGGCCVNPSWSPDSKQILFIDKPSSTAPTGLYAIDVTATLSQSPQVIGQVGDYSPDRSLIAYRQSSQTIVENLKTGAASIIPNDGHEVIFAPDNKHIAWEAEAISGPYDQRANNIYLANIDGRDSARITKVYGGGLIGFAPQGLKAVFYGRPSLEVHTRTLTLLDLTTNIAVDLVSAERLGGISLSNNGTWLAYFITFDADKTRNGIWLQRADGSNAQRLDQWGAYQWRDDSHLLLIPQRTSADRSFNVLEIDAASGASRKLIDGSVTSLNILNGDWRVSPDGQTIVFLNAADRNLWLVKLP